jgi:hypothetical protein
VGSLVSLSSLEREGWGAERGEQEAASHNVCLLSSATEEKVESGLGPEIRNMQQLMGDQNKQLCPQENDSTFRSLIPPQFPLLPSAPHPHTCALSIPISCGASPLALAWLP